ncbi:tRNA-splicing endonuclease subunit sen54 [Aspergillus nanangensis]|uniref:tRNA-splicing endonuclease subunit sen54 n=1 Tax=Aspergillus nanangensis TaxID=2582783 RepID=A0AAD4GXV5_ASPNN|nr:tRNA-splicing endonuclease subunit sen54 [Aspergillus nanangensis]
MADTDEAAIHLPRDSAPMDTDLSDETQDFRMLNNISFLTDGSQLTLPKRGEKDFEPNPTLYQADILSASRQAMHNALSYPRLHHPRNQIVGVYAPDGPAPPPSAAGEDTQLKSGAGVGIHPDSCVYVPIPRGQFFKTMGQADRWNRTWLLPEEALYLLERGSLDIRWPRSMTGSDEEEEGSEGSIEDSGIPMSLQAAYACFIGRGGLAVERFTVYSGLKRLGYTLIRAPGWTDEEEAEAEEEAPEGLISRGPGLAGILGQFLQWFQSPITTAAGPVAGVGIHRSYNDIYRKLAIIPWHNPVADPSPPSRTHAPYCVVFHVYKPSTPFRKTSPPAPDFRIAVVNARTNTTIPTMSQIGSLLDSTPFDPPKGEKMERMLYLRLRQGYRSIILAVVDQGVVSYLRVADAGFGKEKLYAAKAQAGNKRSGFTRPKPKG